MADKHRTRQHKALQRVLLTVRQDKHLTQTDVAQVLRRPQSYVSKYESGERKLDLPELDQVCEALTISLETLIRRYKQELK